MGSIYKITNTVNGKSYIGQTIHDAEKTRIRDHLSGKGNEPVRDDIAKYGKEAFTYEILHDGILPEFLNMLEIEAIAKFNTIAPNGYNLTEGGEGGSHCEETRRKMSQAHKGKKHSEETRRKMSQAHKGKQYSLGYKHSEETRRKRSEALKGENHPMYGRKHSAASRRKMSKAHKGQTPGNKGKSPSEASRRKMSEAKKGKPPWNKGKSPSEASRRKMSQAHKGKKYSEETRRKMSQAHKGKTRSEEHRQKLGISRRRPEYIPAREFFFSLPKQLSLKEKRQKLFKKFDKVVPRFTLYEWCKKFDSETDRYCSDT